MDWSKIRFFKPEDFTCKCVCGQYRADPQFVERLDHARAIAGIPFVVSSGYRCQNHPESLKNPSSSHIKGCAVDLSVCNDRERYLILNALIKAGFTRIGIAKNFIHVDSDPEKSGMVTWVYQ